MSDLMHYRDRAWQQAQEITRLEAEIERLTAALQEKEAQIERLCLALGGGDALEGK